MEKEYYTSIILLVLAVLLVFVARQANEGWSGIAYVALAAVAFFAAIISFGVTIITKKMGLKIKGFGYLAIAALSIIISYVIIIIFARG